MLDLEAELDTIYVLPPGQFTSARNQLEKRLKATGDKTQAARVKALGKPKLTAWLVNWLALRHPAALTELQSAGAAIASAQQSGSADELAAASAARKAQIKALLELSHGACAEHGEKLGAAADRELVTSLETLASLTADTAEPAGRMTQPLAAAGFSAFGVLGLAPPEVARPSTPKSEGKTKPGQARVLRGAGAATEAAHSAEHSESAVHSAENAALSAEQAAAAARRQAELEREHRREQLRAQLTEAEQLLNDLINQAALARSTLESAERRRADTQSTLEANQARVARAEAELVRVKSELGRSQRDLERDQQSVQGNTKGLRQIVEQQALAQELVGQLQGALRALDADPS